MAKLSDVKVDETQLLKKGYSTKDLVGVRFTVEAVDVIEGDNGEYLTCRITGSNIESNKPFNTGAQNVVVKLKAAKEQNMLPVEVTIVKLGANAYDIE